MYRLGADGFKYYLKEFMNKLLSSELRHKVFEKEELIKITKIMEHYPNMMQQRLMRMVEDFNKAREKTTDKPEKEFELLKEWVKLTIEDINSDIKNINKLITKLEKEVISNKPLLSYFK